MYNTSIASISQVLLIPTFLVLCLLTSTYVFTFLRFHIDLYRFQNVQVSKSPRLPQLPYAVPWLGNSTSFLNKKPHAFWKSVFSWYPWKAGALALTLGGQPTTVLFNPTSIHHVMKDRKMGREKFNLQVAVQGFGVSDEEARKYYGIPSHGTTTEEHVGEEKMNLEYLLKTERVNELTADFARIFREGLAHSCEDGPEEVGLYSWLRGLMFKASTTAFWGTRVLEIVPDLEKRFFRFDEDLLTMFFGIPRFLTPKAYSVRDTTLDALVTWLEVAEKEIGPDIPDLNSIQWEPYYGSRINRARHLYYRSRGINRRTQASFNLGALFGLSSNAIPASGWMLMHIIDSTRPDKAIPGEPSLYSHVLTEVEAAQNSDGSLNVPVLVNQPILQSLLHEVLRVYVDTLVSRQMPHDMSLPIGTITKGGKTVERSVFLKEGSLLMLPTYAAHTNPATWQSTDYPHHPPPDVFYPYRFLTELPGSKSGKPTFTTAHANGMLFPFGGGKTICPGRTFGKQEMIAAVAMVLLTLDCELVGYADDKGVDSKTFPGLRQTYPGSAVMTAKGDLKVRMQRRKRP